MPPVKVVVFNNGALSFVEREMKVSSRYGAVKCPERRRL
jgi:thiamine pyrophosphate-dependent acetolactate synthase large subunit-like protein